MRKKVLQSCLSLNPDEILTGLNDDPENSKCHQTHEKIPKSVHHCNLRTRAKSHT